MAPLALLLLFAVTAYMFLYRSRPPQAQGAGSLHRLPMRRLDQALARAGDTDDADEASVQYALVLVDGNPSLDLDAILRVVTAKWDIQPVTPSSPAEQDHPLRRELHGPDRRIAFELIAPLRDEAAFVDAVMETTNGKALASHAAAVLIAVEMDKPSVDQALALSQHVYALLETCPQASAVFWSASHRLMDATQARRVLSKITDERFPVGLWLSARASTAEDGRVQGYTLGLTALGSTEFEALDASEGPQALRERLQSLAEYSLVSCRTIFNGDTTGVDGCERIRLQKVPSQTVHRGWVFQLRYLKASPQQPWETD